MLITKLQIKIFFSSYILIYNSLWYSTVNIVCYWVFQPRYSVFRWNKSVSILKPLYHIYFNFAMMTLIPLSWKCIREYFVYDHFSLWFDLSDDMWNECDFSSWFILKWQRNIHMIRAYGNRIDFPVLKKLMEQTV